jgi:ubiquinone/menaquinone biosynthesis C-methylase UbiE
MSDYYDELSDGYEELYGDEQREKYQFIQDWLQSLEGRVLDVGSGTGIINEFIKPLVLTDSSLEMLKKAKGQRVCCDARFLPFKDKSFNAVTCITVLQDIIDKQKVVKELERVSNGEIIITVLKKLKTRGELEALFKGLKVIDYRAQEKDHCFHLSV